MPMPGKGRRRATAREQGALGPSHFATVPGCGPSTTHLLRQQPLLGQVRLASKLGERTAHHVLDAQLLNAEEVENHQVRQAKSTFQFGWLAQQHPGQGGRLVVWRTDGGDVKPFASASVSPSSVTERPHSHPEPLQSME